MQIDPERIEVGKLADSVTLAGARVLEVGCGDGRLTFRYGRMPRYVVGIEPAAAPLKAANASCPAELRPRIRFVQATGSVLPFADSEFDVVLFSKSL